MAKGNYLKRRAIDGLKPNKQWPEPPEPPTINLKKYLPMTQPRENVRTKPAF